MTRNGVRELVMFRQSNDRFNTRITLDERFFKVYSRQPVANGQLWNDLMKARIDAVRSRLSEALRK